MEFISKFKLTLVEVMEEEDLYDAFLTEEQLTQQRDTSSQPKVQSKTNMASACHCAIVSGLPWWTSDRDLRQRLGLSLAPTDSFFQEHPLTGKSQGIVILQWDQAEKREAALKSLREWQQLEGKVEVTETRPEALQEARQAALKGLYDLKTILAKVDRDNRQEMRPAVDARDFLRERREPRTELRSNRREDERDRWADRRNDMRERRHELDHQRDDLRERKDARGHNRDDRHGRDRDRRSRSPHRRSRSRSRSRPRRPLSPVRRPVSPKRRSRSPLPLHPPLPRKPSTSGANNIPLGTPSPSISPVHIPFLQETDRQPVDRIVRRKR